VLRRPGEFGQYTSDDYQRLLASVGIICSMSRSGDVWDNAVMESFFSTLKIERCNRRRYTSRDEAPADIFDYVERFYNPVRRADTPRWATSARSRSNGRQQQERPWR
jgi:putative transposase